MGDYRPFSRRLPIALGTAEEHVNSENWAKLAMGACALAMMAAPFALAQEEGPAGRGPPTAEQQAAAEKRNTDQAREWNANPAPKGPRDFQGVWWTRGYD